MKNKIKGSRILSVAILFSASVGIANAGDLTIPNTFTAGTPAVASQVNANFAATETAVDDNDSRINALLAQIALLETRLAAVEANSVLTLDGRVFYQTFNGVPEVRFFGTNVKITNGVGTTDSINGVGNLIVGYDTQRAASSDKTGSHNIVVGNNHNYPSYGGLVAGFENAISGPTSSVSGGIGNTASTTGSSVSGGAGNTASGVASSVSGGEFNTASGRASSVSGGGNSIAAFGNTASGEWSSVSGGSGNTASASSASVSGGQTNTASGSVASVSGGITNIASATGSSVSGGASNNATNETSSVSGGFLGEARGIGSSVSGGARNLAEGDFSSVSGGGGTAFSGPNRGNVARDDFSSVSGGRANTANGNYSSVSGGLIRFTTNEFDWAAGTLLEDF